MWKRVKRIGLLLMAGVVVLVVGGLIVIQTGTFQQWLLRRLEQRAGDAGYRVSAEGLSLDLRNLRVSLNGLVYNDENNSSVTVARLSVDIPWNVLREEIIRITSVEADGVVIDLRAGQAAETDPEPTTIPRVVFDNLAIRNAALTYSDSSTTVRIPSFHIETQNGRGTARFDSPITVSPDVQLDIRELALQLSDQSLDFGPLDWRLQHPDITIAGSIRGHLQWSPGFALDFDYATTPFSYLDWRDLESSASVAFENGVVKVTDFRFRSAAGTATGSAELNDQSNSAQVRWSAIDLAPTGFSARTDGDMQLQWKASDFSDLSGDGAVMLESREYGRAQSKVTIRDARANLDIRANAFDSQVLANITTGLDQTLSGTVQAANTQYGSARIAGTLSGTLSDPQMSGKVTAAGITYNGIGPLEASANASLKSRVVSVNDIQLRLKNSNIPGGFLRLDLDSMRVAGEIPEIQLQPTDFAADVSGNVTASARIEGTTEKPVARFSATSDGLIIAGTKIDSVRMTGEANPERVQLTELTAQQRDGALTATGSYNFSSEAIDANASITNLAIDQVPDLTATASMTANVRGTIDAPSADFSGRLQNVNYRNQDHGNLEFEGNIQNDLATVRLQSDKYTAVSTATIGLKAPYTFDASATANRTRVVYEAYDFTADGSLQAAGDLSPFSLGGVEFKDFTVRGEGVDLIASGAFPAGARLNGTVDLSLLPIDTVQATGQARMQAVISGTLQDPRIEGTVETTDATVQAEGMTEPASIQAALDFTRAEFAIRRLQAAYAGAAAIVSGRGTLDGKGNFQFRIQDVRPERLLQDRPVTGVVSVEGEVQMSSPSLEGIEGSAKVTQLELIVANVPVQQVEPIEVRLENQVVTARNIVLEGLNTRTTITGNANLVTRALNFDINGETDLKVVEAFLPGTNPSGQLRTNVTVRGTPENPDLGGSLTLTGAQLQIAEPPVAISEANAQVQLRGDRIQIAGASGNINGGTFTASGGADVSTSGLGNASVQVNLVSAQTEYPEGFLSEISSRLSLNGTGADLEISGAVDILNGAYQRDIDLAQEVFSRISAPAQLGAGPAEPSAIDDIKLNVAIATSGFVSVSNNLANFDMEGSFQLRGTVGNPVLTGRASAAEGGEIYFGPQVGVASATGNERRDRYLITEGSIDFNNPIRTEPNFNFVATREVETVDERYIITLRASGTPDTLKTELTSDPSLDQPNIVALLLTGRTLKDLEGSELTVAQEQAANYLSGRFGTLFQSAGSAFGLNTVRLDPVLVAGEEDLSAKLTIGRDITDKFNLIYSQNLSGPRAQTWIASYRALQDLLVRGINLSDDNKLTVELRHHLKWGGGPPLPRGPQSRDDTTLGNVTFEGTTIPMNELLKQITETGKPFSVYRLNEDVRNLQQFYASRDFLAANVRAVRNPNDRTVDVHFIVSEGPSVSFVFEGARVPRAVQEDIRQIWIRGFSETTSLQQSQDRLLRFLWDDGYLQARLAASDESPDSNSRRFVFDMSPGQRFPAPRWVFKGIAPISLNVTAGTVLENPKAIQDRILGRLWSDGYLNASSTEPRLVIEGRDTRFEISVEPGPRYSIGKITATDPEALQLLPPGEGGRAPGEGSFTSAWLDEARQSIVSEYWADGYNEVQVVAEVDTPKTGTVVNVDFKIEPGKRQVIDKIEIEGNRSTDTNYVLSRFSFKEGDPVDHVQLNLTRRNLYDTGLFRRVDLNVVEGDQGYVARTMLNEKWPWNFRYGFAVTNHLQTSDREFGATADFTYSNFLGRGITVGTSGKYTPDTREARVFSSLPFFLRRSSTTTGAVFRTRDLSIPGSITDLWGFTIQQQWQLRSRYLLSYDYSYKHNHTFDENFDPDDPFAFNLTIPIARFNGTLSRDLRDDLLNATQGTFLSNSFEIAPPGVGSSILFLRNFTQYFRFQPVRENLVWASGIRLGLAKGFRDQELIPTEKFRAGGGTTLRAFQQDQLTAPGDALFIVNQELRFPLIWRFSGVGFFDVGNVYDTIHNFKPWQLRYSPGAGLRVQTPLVLIRLDLGWNVSPKIGEPRYRFSFGVGQAF